MINAASVEAINKQLLGLATSEKYFTYFLTQQLSIFSIIIGVFLAIYFLFNYQLQRKYIQKEVHDYLGRELNILEEKNAKQFNEQFNEITYIKGEVYRAFGQIFAKEEKHFISYIWWLRAAESFDRSEQHALAKIALDSAIAHLEKNMRKLLKEDVVEYQEISEYFGKDKYKSEFEKLDSLIYK